MLKLYRPTLCILHRHVLPSLTTTRQFATSRFTRWVDESNPIYDSSLFRMADKPEAIAQAEKCAAQGNVVRDLKTQKADKAQIDEAVKFEFHRRDPNSGIHHLIHHLIHLIQSETVWSRPSHNPSKFQKRKTQIDEEVTKLLTIKEEYEG